MKRPILFLLSLSPSLLFAQAEASEIFYPGAILGIVILIGVFLALRTLMLWYWKIDKLLKNQQETNSLLRSIDEKLGKQLEQHTTIHPSKDKEDDRWGFVNKGGLSKNS